MGWRGGCSGSDAFRSERSGPRSLLAFQLQHAGPVAQGQADNALTGALRQLFALSEAYPDLKANQNFLALQEELTSTESRVAYARQFYNDSVLEYHNKLDTFPTLFIAKMGNFPHREFFEAEDAARTAPSVKF